MLFIYCNQYSVFLRQASYTLPYNSEVYNWNIRLLFNYMEVSNIIIVIIIIIIGQRLATVQTFRAINLEIPSTLSKLFDITMKNALIILSYLKA